MKHRFSFLCLICLITISLPTYSKGTSEEGPIWLWGLPSSYGGRDIPEEVLTQANQWALEKFGATFRLTSVPEGVTNVEALNRLIAEGEFPDVAILSSDQYNLLAVQKTLADLARFGKIVRLDKYFGIEASYPHLYRAGQVREQMLLGTYDDAIYAAPGKGTRLDEDEPAWAEPMWAIRRDIATDHGMPEDLQQLFVTLKKIQQGQPKRYTDAGGEAVVPLGVYPDVDQWTALVYQLKGAGWEVDEQMRVMPPWASQETYEALKAVNLLWREGLLHSDSFTMDANRASELARGGAYGVTCGPALFVSKAEAPRENVMLVPPIREPDGSIGRYVQQAPGLVVISKECPNADAVMRLMDWGLSREGWITAYLDAGLRGVDWEVTDEPLNWEYMATPGSNYPRPEGVQSGTWRSLNELMVSPPKVPPGLQYLSSATEVSQNPWASHSWLSRMGEAGLPVSYGDNDMTVAPWDPDFNLEVEAKVISPWPSYSLIVHDIGPVESSVFAAARVKWREGLYDVLSAQSPVEFENRYVRLMEGLVAVGDWQAVFEPMQAAWEEWVEEYHDDRVRLQTVKPRPEWQKQAGFTEAWKVTKATMLSAESLQKIYPQLSSYQEIIMETDVTYATVDGDSLRLDLARPAEVKDLVPGIVFIYDHFDQSAGAGAGRSNMRKEIHFAAVHGYVGVAIDYRRSTTHRFSSQVSDVACAIRWLRANAQSYGVDPARVGVMGMRDGAYLALMVAFVDEASRVSGDCDYSGYSSRVQAVVNRDGHTSLPDLYETWKEKGALERYREWLTSRVGGTIEAVPERYVAASPVTYVSEDDPPVLTLQEEGGIQFPLEQAKLLDAKLTEFGIAHSLLGIHTPVRMDSGNVFSPSPSRVVVVYGVPDGEEEEYESTTYDAIFRFLDKHLKQDVGK